MSSSTTNLALIKALDLPIVRVPRSMAQNKPPHGAPCNGCGVCCWANLCKLGQQVFQRPEAPGPCPGLMIDGKSSHCRVALYPREFKPDPTVPDDEMRRAALLVIGAGYGCDCRINGEKPNTDFVSDLTRWDEEHAEAIAKAKRLWGIAP